MKHVGWHHQLIIFNLNQLLRRAYSKMTGLSKQNCSSRSIWHLEQNLSYDQFGILNKIINNGTDNSEKISALKKNY